MNRCAAGGYLVSAKSSLPSDPTDFHLEGLPTVGCTRIKCGVCDVLVRNAPGLAFRTRENVPAAELAALYASTDLAASPLLHQTHAHLRLYLCRCSRWLENDPSACDEPEPDALTDPDMPWGCDGHPYIQLPHDIDGHSCTSRGELRDLATRGFHGFSPPRTRPDDTLRAAWLVRLHERLQPADAAVIATAALSCLEDRDPRTRALVLQFFWRVPDEAAQARLLAILEGDRRLFAGIPDEVTAFPNFDRTLEESIWRVLGPLVAAPGRARDLARVGALAAGKGGRAVYDALARGDSAWVVSSAEDIARATPDRAKDLSGSFAQFPPGVPIGPVRERIEKTLAQPALEAAGPMTFEQALAQPRSLLAAWDFKDPDDDNLGLYAVGASGAKRVASKTIAAEDREEMNEKLRQKDFRIGGAYTYTQHVWVMDDDGFAVWNSNALLAEGSRGELKLRGRKVRARDVTKVVTFVDRASIGHRGVRCELADYTAVIAVEELDEMPQVDPFYNNDTLAADMGWAVFLGFELAMWLSVP
jgi:hypothetical protein